MRRKLYKRKAKALIKQRNAEELKAVMMNWQSPEIADFIYHLPGIYNL